MGRGGGWGRYGGWNAARRRTRREIGAQRGMAAVTRQSGASGRHGEAAMCEAREIFCRRGVVFFGCSRE